MNYDYNESIEIIIIIITSNFTDISNMPQRNMIELHPKLTTMEFLCDWLTRDKLPWES
jgi:hypothetical protein